MQVKLMGPLLDIISTKFLYKAVTTAEIQSGTSPSFRDRSIMSFLAVVWGELHLVHMMCSLSN